MLHLAVHGEFAQRVLTTEARMTANQTFRNPQPIIITAWTSRMKKIALVSILSSAASTCKVQKTSKGDAQGLEDIFHLYFQHELSAAERVCELIVLQLAISSGESHLTNSFT